MEDLNLEIDSHKTFRFFKANLYKLFMIYLYIDIIPSKPCICFYKIVVIRKSSMED